MHIYGALPIPGTWDPASSTGNCQEISAGADTASGPKLPDTLLSATTTENASLVRKETAVVGGGGGSLALQIPLSDFSTRKTERLSYSF